VWRYRTNRWYQLRGKMVWPKVPIPNPSPTRLRTSTRCAVPDPAATLPLVHSAAAVPLARSRMVSLRCLPGTRSLCAIRAPDVLPWHVPILQVPSPPLCQLCTMPDLARPPMRHPCYNRSCYPASTPGVHTGAYLCSRGTSVLEVVCMDYALLPHLPVCAPSPAGIVYAV